MMVKSKAFALEVVRSCRVLREAIGWFDRIHFKYVSVFVNDRFFRQRDARKTLFPKPYFKTSKGVKIWTVQSYMKLFYQRYRKIF